MSKLTKLRRLSLRDLSVVTQLMALCGIVAMGLRMRGWRSVSETISAASRSRLLRWFPIFHLSYDIEGLSPLADMASSIFLGNRCLVRSMVLLWLLRARGQSGEVVLGVRKRGGVFEAHAWTLSERGPIGDQPEALADFERLASSAITPDATEQW
jgi:hypothetical protein